ncbi:MAG: protein translocase subunit SecD [Campylobacterota bacterium]
MNYRLILFVLALVFGIVFSIPSLTQSEGGKKITLGLDLQGGLHMLLGVKSEEAINSKIQSIASAMKYKMEDEEIIFDRFSIEENSITFELLDSGDSQKLQSIFDEYEGLEIAQEGGDYDVFLTTQMQERTKADAIDQAVDTIRNRLNQFGLAEPTVAKQGEEKILVQLPGIKTRQEEQRARELISQSAHLQLMAIDEDRASQAGQMSKAEARSYGDLLLPGVDEQRQYLVKEVPILDGKMLTDARVSFDEQNRPVINFSLNSEGSAIFGDFTAKNVGKRLAIVMDGRVYSAPNIRERIGGGHGQISGNFTPQEAHDVAIALRSGALAAPVYLMEKRSIGPSLGADSIKASLIALVAGFVAVVIFMVWYYGIAGIVSNVALIANLLIILSVMAMFGATLTLPGMAGIVLTVGMAVDANVIINERIRELFNRGVSVAKAIEQGYKNALSAILDANITTLIAAVILYAYGSGPIKGFAITISIGILASMLTAIVGTHGVYQLLYPRIKKSKLKTWFGIKGDHGTV